VELVTSILSANGVAIPAEILLVITIVHALLHIQAAVQHVQRAKMGPACAECVFVILVMLALCVMRSLTVLVNLFLQVNNRKLWMFAMCVEEMAKVASVVMGLLLDPSTMIVEYAAETDLPASILVQERIVIHVLYPTTVDGVWMTTPVSLPATQDALVD